MLRNTFQSGFLSLLYSMGSKPLQLWEEKTAEDGAVKRIVDEDLQSKVIEISASNIARTYIACPSDPRRTLGIRFVWTPYALLMPARLPFLVLIIKNVRPPVICPLDALLQVARTSFSPSTSSQSC